MRINARKREQVERFVKALAGKRLSVRDIERLAQAYFQGPDPLREAIESRKLDWSLQQLKGVPEDREGCNPLDPDKLNAIYQLQPHRSDCVRPLSMKF